MLNEDRLNDFLNAFLGTGGKAQESAQQPDIDFWDYGESAVEPEQATADMMNGNVFAIPKKRRITAGTVVAWIFIILATPFTIWVGLRYFGDRKYLMISLAIAIYSIIPFFVSFEGRKPQTRELLTLAVLVGIAVAGRAIFFMTPNFKPVAAITIIAGVSFGAESGFMVGSLSMLVSNMLFGQGPWTPWQMCAMGLIGFVAGLLFSKGLLKAKKLSLCIFGFLSTLLIYGGIVNIGSLTMFSGKITPAALLMIYMSGFPMDMVHAISTVIFLWLVSKPMLEKLERIKVKYGLLGTE